MKRIIAIILAFSFAITLVDGVPVEAKKKKLKTEKYDMVYFVCGKTYKISKIAKTTKNTESGRTLAKAIKGKKIKWSASSKEVVVKKKSFRIKSPGYYRLTAKTKKHKYVLPVLAVDEKRERDYSQVAYAELVYGNTGESVQISNKNEVGMLCAKIKEAQYTFDYETTVKRLVGWTFWIKFYSADGKLIDDLTTGYTSDGGISYKCKNPDVLSNYVKLLYSTYYTGTKPIPN